MKNKIIEFEGQKYEEIPLGRCINCCFFHGIDAESIESVCVAPTSPEALEIFNCMIEDCSYIKLTTNE